MGSLRISISVHAMPPRHPVPRTLRTAISVVRSRTVILMALATMTVMTTMMAGINRNLMPLSRFVYGSRKRLTPAEAVSHLMSLMSRSTRPISSDAVAWSSTLSQPRLTMPSNSFFFSFSIRSR